MSEGGGARGAGRAGTVRAGGAEGAAVGAKAESEPNIPNTKSVQCRYEAVLSKTIFGVRTMHIPYFLGVVMEFLDPKL